MKKSLSGITVLRGLQIFLWVILLLFTGWEKQLFHVNIWSVIFAKQSVANGLSVVQAVDSPPRMHRRAPAWLVQQGIEQGNTVQVDKWLPVLANLALNDAWTARVFARASLSLNHPTDAINIGVKTQDSPLLLEIAYTTQRNGHFTAALQAYQAGMQINPVETTLPFVDYLLQQENEGAAEATLKESITLYPEAPQSLLWRLKLGEVFASQERWVDAQFVYDNILGEYPENCNARVGLGVALYHQTGVTDLAAEQFQIALQLDPRCAPAYFAMAEMFAKEGDVERAEKWYTQTLDIDPDNQWYTLAWAKFLREHGKIDAAVDTLRSLLTRLPNFAEGHYELARTLRLAGNTQEALGAVSTALRVKVNNRYFLLQGELYEDLGMSGDAARVYRDALAYFPTDKALQSACQHVRCLGQ